MPKVFVCEKKSRMDKLTVNVQLNGFNLHCIFINIVVLSLQFFSERNSINARSFIEIEYKCESEYEYTINESILQSRNSLKVHKDSTPKLFFKKNPYVHFRKLFAFN